MIRFAFDEESPGDGPQVWHGLIRHVQSDAERRFSRMDEAIAFIERRLPIRLAADAPPILREGPPDGHA